MTTPPAHPLYNSFALFCFKVPTLHRCKPEGQTPYLRQFSHGAARSETAGSLKEGLWRLEASHVKKTCVGAQARPEYAMCISSFDPVSQTAPERLKGLNFS